MKLITRVLRATTLQKQLSIAFTLGMLMLALFGSLLGSMQSTSQIRKLLKAQGTLAAETLAQGSQLALMYHAADNAANALRLALALPDVIRVEIRAVDGALLVGADKRGNEIAPADPGDIRGDAPYIEMESDDAWSFVAPVTVERNVASPFDTATTQNIPLGHVRIVQSKATLRQMRTEILASNLVTSFFVALLFLWLIRFLTGRMTGPLARLSDAMARARQGDTDVLADTSRGTRDIATMAHAFNAMMAALWQRESQVMQLNRELERKVERRTAQLAEATRQAEAANRAKSTFLASISHEIRTPLNAVLGYAQLLEHDPQLPGALRANVTPITRAGNHLLHLLSDILDLSKIEAGQMALHATRFDLDALIDEVALMFVLRCEQKGLRWQCDKLLARPCTVDGDAGKLRQVLINLLGNAVKFTEHGSVTLRVEQRGGAMAFEVADTGPGIAAADQLLVFEPFRQAGDGVRHGGTGLGLAIALRQTELMGGQLALQSSPGQGARFSFTLPLAAAPAAALPPALRCAAQPSTVALPRMLASQHPVLLVVDDNPDNRHILATMLDNIGATVLQAGSGPAALELLRNETVNLVLMDIRMPGMDGVETLKRLRRLPGGGAPRCVAITASALAHETQHYLAAGFDGFIAKPFLFVQVCDCLRKLLGVEFVAGAPPAAEAGVTEAIAMPPRWHREVALALDSGWASGVSALLAELASAQPQAQGLARHVAGLLAEFDMDAVRAALQQVNKVTYE